MSRTALLSVYDKAGIVEFAQELKELGWDLLASGGTCKVLQDAGLEVTDVADLVGGRAILGHRVVTLSREIHGGLMARHLKADQDELAALNVPFIDLLCVDLYPLREEIAKPNATPHSVVEKTDVGGPSLLRSAAKGRRIVIANPKQHAKVLAWLKDGEPDSENFRNQLAASAEATVADYVLDSARYTGGGEYEGLIGKLALPAKYGENAWQAPAGLYGIKGDDPLSLDRAVLVEGSPPSYNNLVDVDRLLQTVTHIAAGFDENFGLVPHIAVGVKHGNAAGASVGKSGEEAVRKMVLGDPRAIFGGLVMVNFPVTKKVAEELTSHGVDSGRRLLDGVIAPSFEKAAVEILARKGGRCRLLQNPALGDLTKASLDNHTRIRYVRGGFVSQSNYTQVLNLKSKHLTSTEKIIDSAGFDIILAWAVGSTSNSNTITLVKNGQLLGNGVGQQDRVGCCELAIKRAKDAGHNLRDATAYSDSFFPFPDGPEVLADAGITTIFASSGSVKDDEVRELCKQKRVTLVQLPDADIRGFYNH